MQLFRAVMGLIRTVFCKQVPPLLPEGVHRRDHRKRHATDRAEDRTTGALISSSLRPTSRTASSLGLLLRHLWLRRLEFAHVHPVVADAVHRRTDAGQAVCEAVTAFLGPFETPPVPAPPFP